MEDDRDCHRPPQSPDPRRPIVCPKGYSWGGPSQPECLRDSDYTNLPPTVYPLDIGVVVGLSTSCGIGAGGSTGIELVLDLYDLEVDTFANLGFGPAIGGSISGYMGFVTGWSSFRDRGVHNYKGFSGAIMGSLKVGATVQGGVTRPSPGGGKLWALSVGAGASLGANFNGPALEKAIELFSQLPVHISAGAAYYFTAEDAGKFIGQQTGLDIQLPSTQQTFHELGRHPTGRDARDFSLFMARLAVVAPVFAMIAPFSIAVANYNAHAWELQDAYEGA